MADDSHRHEGGTTPEKDSATPLTDQDLAILRLEQRWPHGSWQKLDDISRVLRLSQTRFQQRLRVLARDRRAIEQFPQVCARVVAREAHAAAKRADRTF